MSRPAVDIRPPSAADVDELAANMREQDVAEVGALGHTDMRALVQACVDASKMCWAAHVNGQLACIFGLSVSGTVLAPWGAPWMLGTPLVPRHRRDLARLAPHYIERMLQATPDLFNLVHAHNTVSVRWLKRMGFHLREAMPTGPFGEPFHLFEMHAHV